MRTLKYAFLFATVTLTVLFLFAQSCKNYKVNTSVSNNIEENISANINGEENISANINAEENITTNISEEENIKDIEKTFGEVVVLTKKDFLEKVFDYEKNRDSFIYEGNLPCIIDFYADWCGPCKKVEPILKELAKEYEDKIIIYKINTDRERELARAFGIQSIPTYFFIPAEGDPLSAMGAMPRESFVRVIDEILLKSPEDRKTVSQ